MTEHVTTPASAIGRVPPIAEAARRDIPAFVRPGDRLMTIGGRRVPAVSGLTLANVDPATEEPLASIPRGGAEDIDRAVRAAQQAFTDASWAGIDPDERGRILFQIAAVIDEHADELAAIESHNMGMPLMMTRHMMAGVAQIYRHYAGWPTKLYGHTVPTVGNRLGYTRKEPLGVVGLIWGWNGPMPQLALKLAPALAAGNTTVLKPPEWASLTTLRLAELLESTDLPAGVVNVVTGTGAEAGEALIRHPGVAKIGFTGSTATGKHVHEVASADLKRLTLELGGKSPIVICADADLDAAAHGAAIGFLAGSGQACTAGTRLFVQDSIREEFIDRLVKVMDTFTVGDPFDPATRMGPLAARQHFERVTSYFEIAAQDGATIRAGGKRYGDRGFFVAPTLLTDVTPDMRVAKEEIFGPVGALMSFTDLDDAIVKANQTEYGLAASVWTKDLSTAHRLAAEIDAGTVWVNTHHEMTSGPMPFHGFKQSGIGGEGGFEAMDAYTRTKAVLIAL
ncbi:acyl-CoA reductase-like NAD-dependent aldehyde dehydrogenase [Thermocatellispora tengchongensis]|uniref:Acyl-CoA reductase-like NAD-dependent aldehyde dehydrogenase n=1 Tax=Thermocatellispora tengchongensis TaxID=1073253 RepID=A0A840PI11_9ACTN|nr:aldehyde dehydrogenase family protein [Thermocatellispora tengchongensis]MBB5136757.1 acyl-CoA reductase-like NAD-dependent aldehyde dehydrogenase [Thermocatellispora tengchongensis]